MSARHRYVRTPRRTITAAGLVVLVIAATGGIGLDAARGALPGVNGKISFVSNKPGNYDVFIADANGANATNLTQHPAAEGGAPAWSPDGKTVVFTSNRDGDDELFSMPADGSAPAKQLTFNTGAFDGFASFSPDGAFIAFVSGREGNNEIFTMRADGSLQSRLTVNAANDTDPSWSPMGDRIIFVSDRATGQSFEIFSSDLFGNTPTNLTNNPAFDADPDWSPDGRSIVFASNRGGDFEIIRMNADGTGQTPLTTNAVWDSFPVWSPDGTKVLFQSNRAGGSFDIAVMNADGTGQTLVTTDPADEQGAGWQPTAPPPGPSPPPPPPPPPPLPTILTGRMAYNFSFRQGAGVTLNRFSVFDMKRGSIVTTRCLRGCSVIKRRAVPGAGWNLQPLFRGKRLRLPMSVEVRITKPGLVIGRYLRLDITRRAGRVRSRVTECRIAYPSRTITNCRRI